MTEVVKERPMPNGEGLTFEKVWAMFQETDRKFLGGIAGAIWDKDLKKDVQNAGLFVIEQFEDTFMIDIPEGWKPVEF